MFLNKTKTILSKQNYLLLVSMFLSCVGMFSFFPYLATELPAFSHIEIGGIGFLMLVGMIVGNSSSYIVINIMPENKSKEGFYLSIFCFVMVMGFCYLSSMMASLAYILVLATLILYRFSVGFYFSYSRILQIEYLPNKEHKNTLFSYIKVVNSVGGAVGPMLGALVLGENEFDGVLNLALLCFACSFFIAFIALYDGKLKSVDRDKKNNKSLSFKVSSKTFLICIASFFHYIFEAQIYTYFTLVIKKEYIAYTDIISYVFAINSILLILLTIYTMKIINKIKNKTIQYAIGNLFSCFALILFSISPALLSILYLSILLFTIGEIIVPQVGIISVSEEGCPGKLKSNISFYNLCTSAFGMGVGSYLGVLVFELNDLRFSISLWLSIFLFSSVLFFIGNNRNELVAHGG